MGTTKYSYNASWDVLTGYPSGYGADNQINDHHFHMSYAIVSAATIAQYDQEWASQEQWGGMVNMLIRDANNGIVRMNYFLFFDLLIFMPVALGPQDMVTLQREIIKNLVLNP